jgi:hypothetical protein
MVAKHAAVHTLQETRSVYFEEAALGKKHTIITIASENPG